MEAVVNRVIVLNANDATDGIVLTRNHFEDELRKNPNFQVQSAQHTGTTDGVGKAAEERSPRYVVDPQHHYEGIGIAPDDSGLIRIIIDPAYLNESVDLKKIGSVVKTAAERVVISRILEQTHWNRTEAAKLLGISYKALLYKMEQARLSNKSGEKLKS